MSEQEEYIPTALIALEDKSPEYLIGFAAAMAEIAKATGDIAEAHLKAIPTIKVGMFGKGKGVVEEHRYRAEDNLAIQAFASGRARMARANGEAKLQETAKKIASEVEKQTEEKDAA